VRRGHPRGLDQSLPGLGAPALLATAGSIGLAVGLFVAGFEWITVDLSFAMVCRLPIAVQALVPVAGLAVNALVLRAGRLGPSTSPTDEYIRAVHGGGQGIEPRVATWRLLAAAITLGSGVPLGHEGPALYAGAAVGEEAQRRVGNRLSASDRRALLMAGAAAGVAAVILAPVTAVVFALEVPFRDHVARRMVLPAAISAGAGYLASAGLASTEPPFSLATHHPLRFVDLVGGALVGLLVGAFTHGFAGIVRGARRASLRWSPPVRVAIAGSAIAAGAVVSERVFGAAGLGLGSGSEAMRWAFEDDHGLVLVVLLVLVRTVGVAAAVAGGGVGGLTVPLLLHGALLGRVVDAAVGRHDSSLFVVVGMASALGAGYQVPLTAIVLLAELSGQPGYVVPGLVAVAVGRIWGSSVSPFQMLPRDHEID